MATFSVILSEHFRRITNLVTKSFYPQPSDAPGSMELCPSKLSGWPKIICFPNLGDLKFGSASLDVRNCKYRTVCSQLLCSIHRILDVSLAMPMTCQCTFEAFWYLTLASRSRPSIGLISSPRCFGRFSPAFPDFEYYGIAQVYGFRDLGIALRYE